MSREIDFLKKFKKLSSMNEANITKISDTDDTLPHQHLGLSEEDANKDQNIPNPNSGSTTGTTGSTSGSTLSAVPPSVTSPESEFDQNTLGSVKNTNLIDDTKEKEEDIQNELLKLQVSAMKKMSDKISELEEIIGQMNISMNNLKSEVNKVKDPSPMEKLENKWKDSYPFKYTLGDIWDGNVFQGRKDLFDDSSVIKNDSVIKQTPDGSFEAKFDEMPKISDFELKKSFEVY